MKKECVICTKFTGKRTCKLKDNKIICPACCVSIRNHDCEGCIHYKFSKEYQNSKHKHSKIKHFIIEINEEIEESVDHALELVEKDFFEKGETIIKQLIKDHPQNHQVQYAMGVLHALRGQHDEAIEYFDKATDIFPYFLEAYFNKAVAYKNKLDIKNMVRAFQSVIEIGDSKNEVVKQAKSFIGELEQQTLKSEGINLELYLKAMEKFEKALYHMKNQEWKKAIFYFRECLAINKKHPQSYGNIGICYSKLGQKEQALEAFDEALEIDPNYELAIINRSIVASLKNGEELTGDVEQIDYYKESAIKKRPYIQSFFQKLNQPK